MDIVLRLALALQILSAVAMIGLILMQHGKGADMGAAFGSGASGSLFGASGSANFLSRSTAILATVFLGCTLFLSYAGSSSLRAAPSTGGSSVLDRLPVPTPAASAPATAASEPASASGATAIPTDAAPAPAPSAPAPATPASGAAQIPAN